MSKTCLVAMPDSPQRNEIAQVLEQAGIAVNFAGSLNEVNGHNGSVDYVVLSTGDLLKPRLTRREWQVAELLCENLKVMEVADRLRVEPGTVESHKYNLMRKVGARNRLTLYWWYQNNKHFSPVPKGSA